MRPFVQVAFTITSRGKPDIMFVSKKFMFVYLLEISWFDLIYHSVGRRACAVQFLRYVDHFVESLALSQYVFTLSIALMSYTGVPV